MAVIIIDQLENYQGVFSLISSSLIIYIYMIVNYSATKKLCHLQ